MAPSSTLLFCLTALCTHCSLHSLGLVYALLCKHVCAICLRATHSTTLKPPASCHHPRGWFFEPFAGDSGDLLRVVLVTFCGWFGDTLRVVWWHFAGGFGDTLRVVLVTLCGWFWWHFAGGFGDTLWVISRKLCGEMNKRNSQVQQLAVLEMHLLQMGHLTAWSILNAQCCVQRQYGRTAHVYISHMHVITFSLKSKSKYNTPVLTNSQRSYLTPSPNTHATNNCTHVSAFDVYSREINLLSKLDDKETVQRKTRQAQTN